MGYASTTPATVRRAVAIYSTRRRWIGVGAALLTGIAAAAGIALAFMLLDRYTQWPQVLRAAGPWLAILALMGGVAWAVAASLRRHDPFRVAARLDRAFPQHQDRWSSSLDLAEQIQAGRNAGDQVCLNRLFADTETLPAESVYAIVPHKPVKRAAIAFVAVAVAVFLVAISPAFNFGLLWQRFVHPFADLPRDSATRIVLLDVNGRPFTGTMPGPLAEGSPFTLRVELRRKPGFFAFGLRDELIEDADQLAPRLERETPAGTQVTEFSRAGSAWVFTQPRLDESLAFRIGVDDAMTQRLGANVLPRIKLAGVETGIRFPRYTHVKDQPMGAMQGNRVSALTDSVIDFHANFDRPLQSISATYEAMKSDKDAGGDAVTPPADAPKQFAESSRRNLRVQKRGDSAARFTLPVDASGILRLRAVGANGLAGEEWVCTIEATPDAPPRILVTGLEPDTTIVPGETVSFQYRAEDDLAITDVVMDWSSEGGGHSSNLGGDEYFKSPQLGGKLVTGTELIQRMNYPFYATEPFQFFLSAIDSKGQESHSETYRVHTVSDDYATRFERGMELLKDAGAYQARYKGQLGGLTGQLNIIATAAGDSKTWEKKLDPQLENFLRTASNYDDPWFFVKHLTLRYGGVPYRLNRSLQMIMAVPDAMASRADFVALGMKMKTTDDLPGVIAKLRALIEGQRPMVEAWGKAIDAEKARFLPEHLLNEARGPAARLAALAQVQQPPEVAAANLKFYLTQIDAWLAAAAPLAMQDPQFQPLIDALKAAREQAKADAIVIALHPIIEKLSSQDLAPDDALTALGSAMTQIPPGVADADSRFPTMAARMVMTAGQSELVRPAEIIAVAQPWITGQPTPAWYPAPASCADAIIMAHQVWEALRMYHADVATHRFDLNPQEAVDHESIIRERALSAKEELRRLDDEAIDPARRDRLVAALDRLAKPGAAADEALLVEFTGALRGLGVKPIAELGSTAKAVVEKLTAAMRKTADEYDRHADAVTKEAQKPTVEGEIYLPSRMALLDAAGRLQVRTEGLESLYRAVKSATIQSRLLQPGKAAAWSEFKPWHGAQLSMSLCAAQAGESVSRIHVELSSAPAKAREKYPIAARNAHELAERLRSTAKLIEAASRGEPISFDYAQLMKDARAEGLLPAMKEEYELVQSIADAPDGHAPAGVETKLNKSAMARIVRAEQALSPLQAAAQKLKQASAGKPPEVLAALESLQKALPAGTDAPAIEALPAAIKEAAAAPADDSVAKLPALARRLSAVNESLASLTESYRDQARLPAINTTTQQNRRFTTRDLPNVWVIGGVIDGFDRRWLYTMRDLELSLTRTMLEVSSGNQAKSGRPNAANATDLKLQYGRMVEWRARNFANDRRRNQGISLLAPDAGPSLRLPEHIAEEFLPARNLQSPEDFKPRIETYYEELYRDLAK